MPIQCTVTGIFSNLDPEKQQRIMEAAVHEFDAREYHAASMHTVVGRAAIAKGALFKYVGNKKDLGGYVYRAAPRRVNVYFRTVSGSTKNDDFFLRLQKIMQAGVDVMEEHPRLARIYYHSIRSADSPYEKEVLRELHKASLKCIRSLIEDAMERGELRDDLNPRTTALALESVIERFLQLHKERTREPGLKGRTASATVTEEWIREVVDLFRDGWANGPREA